MNFTSYHAKYLAHQLTRKFAADDLGKLTASLQDAKVDLNPHQVEAALFAFKSPLSYGAILADEVGLGKTIEAGIILSQKWAERKRKLLIICPANLRKQWNQELIDKFYLSSVILESKNYNQLLKDGVFNPFEQNDIVLCSFQFARAKADKLKLVNWDLVIIDEAHRLRNVYKPSNKIGNSIKDSLEKRHKILLTATPLQNSLLELYGLVSIIDEYAFGDLKSFKAQYSRLIDEINFESLRKRLAPICKRTLRSEVMEYINYTNRIAICEKFEPFDSEQELYKKVSEYLQRDNLYALPPSQKQLMTLIIRKLLASSSFAIQGTLEGLANKLEARLKQQKDVWEESIASDFESYDEIKDEWTDADEDELIEVLSGEQLDEIQKEIIDLKNFYKIASGITKNAKGERLITALNKGFSRLNELGALQKAIIFTESTRTQNYLKAILESNGFNNKLVLFNGSNNDAQSRKIYNNWKEQHKGTDRLTGSRTADMRQALVEYFRDHATIMIATEAAAEGINLQFCSLIVNFDMPWNPQRIEQRIGRCHRYGQKFDVVVVNFLNVSNEADVRVYQLLDEKFKLFEGVFGSSDEVLGSIESGVDFEKRIAKIYNECRDQAQIRAEFDILQKELEPEIEERIDLTRQRLLENFDTDVHKKLKFNYEKGKEYLSRYEQQLWDLTKYYLADYAEFNQSLDTFKLKRNPFPNENIHPGPYLILRTKEGQKKSQIEVADDTNIYRAGHPLAKRIVEACKNKKLESREIVFDYTGTGKVISVLKDFVGKSGWLQASLLTISSFEVEEHILLSGFTEQNQLIDEENCQRFFELFASESKTVSVQPQVSDKFKQLHFAQKQSIIQDNMRRNAQFFQEEIDKVDKWADDRKLSLEKELKDIEDEIKLRKGEARKLLDLKRKVEEQRIIKDLEKKRSDKRQNLYEAQDQIDKEKDQLLDSYTEKLEQQITEEILFTINWKLQ